MARVAASGRVPVGDPVSWIPRIAAYFRANPLLASQRTDVAAGMSSSDLTQWTNQSCTNSTANTLVCDAGYHDFSKYVGRGIVDDHSFRLTFDCKSTGSLTHVRVTNITNWSVTAHANDGTVHSTTGSPTVTSTNLGNGWWRYTADFATTGSNGYGFIYVNPCDANGAPSWTAAGGESIQITNISLTQTNVSALGSIAGQAVSAVQATAANRPQVQWYHAGTNTYTPINMSAVPGWRPVLYFDGVNDSITTNLSGMQNPYTVLAYGRYVTAANAAQMWNSGGVDGYNMYAVAYGGSVLACSGGTPAYLAYHSAAEATMRGSRCIVYGSQAAFWYNGVKKTAITGTDIGTTAPAALRVNPIGAAVELDEILICNGILDPTTIANYHTWAAARYP